MVRVVACCCFFFSFLNTISNWTSFHVDWVFVFWSVLALVLADRPENVSTKRQINIGRALGLPWNHALFFIFFLFHFFFCCFCFIFNSTVPNRHSYIYNIYIHFGVCLLCCVVMWNFFTELHSEKSGSALYILFFALHIQLFHVKRILITFFCSIGFKCFLRSFDFDRTGPPPPPLTATRVCVCAPARVRVCVCTWLFLLFRCSLCLGKQSIYYKRLQLRLFVFFIMQNNCVCVRKHRVNGWTFKMTDQKKENEKYKEQEIEIKQKQKDNKFFVVHWFSFSCWKPYS